MTRAEQLPIGVFDSGLGGLTVLRALRTHLPGENLLYLGDIARLPYGTKSSAVVGEYARQCVKFLLGKQVKAIVIACNTASAMALDLLKEEVPVPVFGVVEPGVRAAMALEARKEVLVLATQATVRSEAYPRIFDALSSGCAVNQLACPLLVPLAEEGWFDHPITRDVIAEYLKSVDLSRFGSVLLGCTHFPLLEPSFRKVLPHGLSTVHGGQVLAEQVRHRLEAQGALNPQSLGWVRLLTTDRIRANLPMMASWAPEIAEAGVVHL